MIDFDSRLKSLKERRQGPKVDLEKAMVFDGATRFNVNESQEKFETLSESPSIKYTLGAMSQVSSKSTRISIDEGNRVADSLIKSLFNQGENVTKKLQGSVALNVHIKGHSDVDMLILEENTVNIETPSIRQYGASSDSRNSKEIVRDIRIKSEKILPMNFPAANIDITSSKCISVEGGSLNRVVDIVPAIWFHSLKYQSTSLEHYKGVKIYEKSKNDLLLNYPFLHIHLIHERDQHYSGNLKCIIRLMKNIIADMTQDRKAVSKALTSYDLAAIAYHMDRSLFAPQYLRLGLVEQVREHLDYLIKNHPYRLSLLTPDQTRCIFNTTDKFDALQVLHNEFKELTESIHQDLFPFSRQFDSVRLKEKSVLFPTVE